MVAAPGAIKRTSPCSHITTLSGGRGGNLMAGSGRGCTPALMALAAGKARAGQPEGGRAGNTASKDPAHATEQLVATIRTKHVCGGTS